MVKCTCGLNCSKRSAVLLISCIVGLVSLIFAYSMPWYYITLSYEQADHEKRCDISHLISWDMVYCDPDTDNCGPTVVAAAGGNFCPRGEEWNWRDQDDFGETEKQEEVWNMAAGALAISTFCCAVSLGMAILLCLNCLRGFGWRIIHASIALLAVLFILASVVLFAVDLPEAMSDENSGFCTEVAFTLGTNQADDGPCHSFIGATRYDYPVTGEKMYYTWGGAGYWIGVWCAIPLIVATGAAILPKKYDHKS